VDRCEGCAFVYDLSLAPIAADEIVAIAARISDIVASGGVGAIRARPRPQTWSALEYACHVRDVLLVQRERVLLALRVDEPSVETMGRDERVEADGYNEQQPVDVARQLNDAALMFAGVLRRLDARSWERTLIYNYPVPSARSLEWVAVHTLHELTHHLRDVELPA
jgi:hypothetical protein